MSILETKKYPSEYPKDAVKVLDAMSFTKSEVKIMGSASLKSQLYAGDYDAYEAVDVSYMTDEQALKHLAAQFKTIIRRLSDMKNVYIGDIKAGLIEEWNVVTAPARLDDLLTSGVVSKEEAEKARHLLADTTEIGRLKAAQELKFHIIRWTPKQVLAGKQDLRDGRTYTLEQAFNDPTITKLDTVALVEKRYTDFSMIYRFSNRGHILNDAADDVTTSLSNAIKLYEAEGNRFKVIKRKFSLARLHNNKKDLAKYNSILNSEAGKLYIIYSDVKVLADLLEQSTSTLGRTRISEALRGLKHRLAKIYRDESTISKEKGLLADLEKATEATNPLPILRHAETQLFDLLNATTKRRGGSSRHYSPYLSQ
jgi:hypothetical protein